MSTRILARLIFCPSKYCRHRKCYSFSRIALRYYSDSVTVILTAPSLQTYVMSRAVTESIVTQSHGVRRLKRAASSDLAVMQGSRYYHRDKTRWRTLSFVANSVDRILLKHRQSVFPLFGGFVFSVIVVFCCCLFTSSVFS